MEVDIDRRSALDQLDVLVGEWAVIADYEDAPEGRATIEWALDRQYLLARSAVPHPDFPDTVFIISVNPDGETYSQHYFDTNNSVRVYKMTLHDGTWSLLRDEPDFTPLDFAQRFTARISTDGRTISGAWEHSDDGREWTKDFDLTYRRIGPAGAR